jgi:hypothetical protein
MKLLTYQWKENVWHSFKVEDTEFKYSFTFPVHPTHASEPFVRPLLQVEFGGYFRCPAQNIMPFNIHLPIDRSALQKQLGGWIGMQIRGRHPEMDNYIPFGIDHRVPLHIRKIKSYAYLTSSRISRILSSWISREFMMRYDITQDSINNINKVVFRLYQHRKEGQHIWNVLWEKYKSWDIKHFNILINDLLKYNNGFCKYLIDVLRQSMSFEQYLEHVKVTPILIKKNKYNLELPREMLEWTGFMPQSRWQWFVMRISYRYLDEASNFGYEHAQASRDFANKLLHSDVSVWRYYRKANHIERPYSTKFIDQMFHRVLDGSRLYNQYKGNQYGISFVPVDGSAMRMLRNAMYNHRQEQEYTKQKRLSGPNHVLCNPPVKLPEWIEKIRLKTAHDMIQAGIECMHCIGSYVDSPDIFVRDKDICAQIYRHTLEVGQCYDVRDQITKASESLRKRLDKDLQPLRELINAVR